MLRQRLIERMCSVAPVVSRFHSGDAGHEERGFPAIREIVPGLRNPTVVPLADPEWVAIHTAVEEGTFWEIIERLREAGASEILVSPIEKLVMA